MKANEQIEKVFDKLKFWGIKLTRTQEEHLRLALVEIALSSSTDTLLSLKQNSPRINEKNDE